MIHDQIKKDIHDAMKARDGAKLRAARNALAACINELVAQKRKPQEHLSDQDALSVLGRLAKQRKESIAQFEEGGRADLVKPEKEELAYLEAYLPEMMGTDEIRRIAVQKKDALGVTDASKKGVFMGALMKELGGKADGKDVKKVVDEIMQ